MGFDLENYNTVQERIQEFKTKHPEGTLGIATYGEDPFKLVDTADGQYIVVTRRAYRYPDDEQPGVGTAWEAVPGKTSFARGRELQNAETAAWGRAIVAALAADATKDTPNQPQSLPPVSSMKLPKLPAPTATPAVATPQGFVFAETEVADHARGLTLGFGKHKGETLQQVSTTDINWLNWYLEQPESDCEPKYARGSALTRAAMSWAANGGFAEPASPDDLLASTFDARELPPRPYVEDADIPFG